MANKLLLISENLNTIFKTNKVLKNFIYFLLRWWLLRYIKTHDSVNRTCFRYWFLWNNKTAWMKKKSEMNATSAALAIICIKSKIS